MQQVKKRFTDTLKWEKEWFLSLTPNDKIIWLYLLDSCDEAGLWNVNWRLCSMLTGVEFSEPPSSIQHQLVETNHDKVLYIKDFMEFQYPDYMEKKSPMIAKCVKKLIRYGIIEQSDYDSAQSEIRVAGRVQEKEKEVVKEVVKDIKPKKDVSLSSINKVFLNELQMKNMDVDVPKEFEKFKNHIEAKGKRFKNYQAAFRNWVSSPFVEKTTEIRDRILRRKEEAERARKAKEYEESSEEDYSPPADFLNDFLKNKRKIGNNG